MKHNQAQRTWRRTNEWLYEYLHHNWNYWIIFCWPDQKSPVIQSLHVRKFSILSHSIIYIWNSANPWWWGFKPQFLRDQTSNHTNISECKHMQGMKPIFECDRPKKIPAQQLLYQWTVELPLALKLPRCATCVQWIVLISGPDRVRVIIKSI